MPPTLLEQIPALTATNPTQFTTYLIAHASADAAFATRLQQDLAVAGLRCYRHQEVTGPAAVFVSMDRATPIYDKLIVVCSKNSLQRTHVLRELEQAASQEVTFQEYKTRDARVLFFLEIDDYLRAGWQHPLKEKCLQHFVGDSGGGTATRPYTGRPFRT